MFSHTPILPSLVHIRLVAALRQRGEIMMAFHFISDILRIAVITVTTNSYLLFYASDLHGFNLSNKLNVFYVRPLSDGTLNSPNCVVDT